MCHDAPAPEALSPNRFPPGLATKQVINVASVPHRSPFRYPGGKTWLVPHVRQWLARLPARPRYFAEPFAGGASVGLSVLFEDRCDRLDIVELDDDVAAVWQTILNGDAKRLVDKILSFAISPESVRSVLSERPKDLLDHAFATILRNRVQRGGIMAPGASLMKQGENGRGLTSRWYPQTLRKRILAISARSDRIRFLHGDGIQFLAEHAPRADVAFLIDPPYTVAGRRLYAHSKIDHGRLFRTTAQVRGPFLMTYDNAPPIRHLAATHRFAAQEVAMKNSHHAIRTELLIGRDLSWLD